VAPDISNSLTIALVPVLLWWVGTGLVLRNAHGQERIWPMAALTAAVPVCFLGLVLLSPHPATSGVVLTSYALVFVLWAWLEVSFYLGYVTGPVKSPCPPDASTGRRLLHGLASSAYHEAAMIALGVALFVVADGGARWAPWFYATLAVMHTSARLNVVLGVRNLNEHFLPRRLSYLSALFRKRPMNGLMPLSILASVALSAFLVVAASAAEGGEATALIVLSTLAVLGVLEHLLLVLPLPGHRLFEWGLPGPRG